MGGFLNFDKMITPIFIKIAFWLGIIGSLLAGIGLIISGVLADKMGFLQILMGLGVFIVGPFLIRVYCELLIILFKMHESMREIKIALSDQPRIVSRVESNNNEVI